MWDQCSRHCGIKSHEACLERTCAISSELTARFPRWLASLDRQWLGSSGSQPGFHYGDNPAPWDLEAGSGPWDQPLMALGELATAQEDSQRWPKTRFAAGHSQRTVGWMERNSEIMLGLSCSPSLTVFLTSWRWLGTGGRSHQTYLWNDMC